MLCRDPHVAVVRRERGEALERPVVRLLQPDGGAGAREDLDGAARHALRDVGDTGRLGEVAGELEERFRAFGLPSLCLVQARVLERDGRMAGHHLEKPEVVGVELVEPELGDDDHACHARPVSEWDGEKRLFDVGGPRDPFAELVIRGVAHEERLALVRHPARDAAADLRGQKGDGVARLGGDEVAPERDGHEVVVLAEEHAAVVVVDQQPELVGHREPDLLDVVQPRELPREALEHLEVRDGPDVVASDVLFVGTLARALVERHHEPLPAGLRRHHRGLGAGDELARVGGVLGADGDPGRDRELADRLGLEQPELDADALGERSGARMSPAGRITANSSPPTRHTTSVPRTVHGARRRRAAGGGRRCRGRRRRSPS